MLLFKNFFNLLYLIELLIVFQLCAAQPEECDKIIIEGDSNTLKKLFMELIKIKETVMELQTNTQECSNNSENKRQDHPLFDIRYDALPKKCVTEFLPKNCAEATVCTQRSGIYRIQVVHNISEPFYVECDAVTENGDWTVIQRRQDGSEDFHRNWADYEEGFGDIDAEFFIGLKKLYALTNCNGPQELLVIMEHPNNTRAFAKYDMFAIGNNIESYKLKKLGKYTGTAGDSLNYQFGMKFTTKDHDNDTDPSDNCAQKYTGAWWYIACHASNLNGKYGETSYGKGVIWHSFTGHHTSLKYVRMMIRRRRSTS